MAYSSFAYNLVPGDQNGSVRDAFVFHLFNMTNVAASVNAYGEWGNSYSGHADIDSIGRRVVFASWASNLDPQPAPFESHVFLMDRGAVSRRRRTTSKSKSAVPPGLLFMDRPA